MVKNKIIDEMNNIEDELVSLSKRIHENPELSFQEYIAMGAITDLLDKHGFLIEKGIAGLETAFIAEYKGLKDGPTIAFIAEYDALPEMGHACGHNLIAAMSTGAAIALSKIISDYSGRVLLIGTPAEESGGGKVIMVEKGIFDHVDYALMIHPSNNNMICRGGLATRGLKIEYHGASAHSCIPESGINALQAVIQTFNAIDHLRAILPLKANVNGIIKDGGRASNIIPDYASCEFGVRADTVKDLKFTVDKIEMAIKSVEVLTGAEAKFEKTNIYTERYPNRFIAERLKDNMVRFNEDMLYPEANIKYGSSDIGNVSLVVPTIHSYLKTAQPGINGHTIEFAKASKADYAHQQMIKGAMGLALTGYDILSDKELQKDIYDEFHKTVPKYSKSDLK